MYLDLARDGMRIENGESNSSAKWRVNTVQSTPLRLNIHERSVQEQLATPLFVHLLSSVHHLSFPLSPLHYSLELTWPSRIKKWRLTNHYDITDHSFNRWIDGRISWVNLFEWTGQSHLLDSRLFQQDRFRLSLSLKSQQPRKKPTCCSDFSFSISPRRAAVRLIKANNKTTN